MSAFIKAAVSSSEVNPSHWDESKAVDRVCKPANGDVGSKFDNDDVDGQQVDGKTDEFHEESRSRITGTRDGTEQDECRYDEDDG